MRVIKLGLISIIAFSLLVTLISLFFPSHIRISKAIDINSSRDSIHATISRLENWKRWYPGADTMDLVSENGKLFLQARSTRQAISIERVTDSTIIAGSAGKNIKKAVIGWNIFNSNMPNTYTVQWYMDIHLGWYPWDKFSGLLLEKRYGPSMEKGLDTLKKILEGSGGSR